MNEIPKWMMRDPAKVYERIEAIEQAQAARTPQAKQDRARKKLEELFKEGHSDRDNK